MYIEACQFATTSASQQANIYPWGRLPSNAKQITFWVKARDNAHIGLASEANDNTVLAEVGRSNLVIFQFAKIYSVSPQRLELQPKVLDAYSLNNSEDIHSKTNLFKMNRFPFRGTLLQGLSSI